MKKKYSIPQLKVYAFAQKHSICQASSLTINDEESDDVII